MKNTSDLPKADQELVKEITPMPKKSVKKSYRGTGTSGSGHTYKTIKGVSNVTFNELSKEIKNGII